MSFASVIHDPLEINLHRQTRRLLSSIQPNTHHWRALNNVTTTRQLLSILSSLLAVPAFTQLVATYFRPILIELCVRWLEGEHGAEGHLFALCYLVEVHEELFPILSKFLLNFHPNGPLSFITGTLSPLSVDTTRLERLLLAYYRLLQANRELPRTLLWTLVPLSHLISTPHLGNGVRLLAIRCYSLQSGMGEEERCSLEREILGEPCGIECNLNYGQNVDGSEKEVDGWLLPVLEIRRVQQERESIVSEQLDFYSREAGDDTFLMETKDLSPLVVNVHGVLLLRSSPDPPLDSSLVPLTSSCQSLRHIALCISLRLPTLLTSAPSAGKQLLLSHLSGLLHPRRSNQIVIIHLADTSLDARALLGSYVSSTAHPGTFDWKEGVLVRSMREGKWIVFKDIDRGSNEVLGVIKPLVESLNLWKWVGGRAKIDIPGRGTIVAHEHFMLFASRSLAPSRNGVFQPPTFFGSHKFTEIVIESPPLGELRSIVNTKFPRLTGATGVAVIELWDSVVKLGSQTSGRDVGIRELLKFCQRIDKLLPTSYQPMDVDAISEEGPTPTFAEIFPNPTLREDIYLEARDTFFGSGTLTASARAHSKAVAEIVGERLCLDSDVRKWVLEQKSAEFDVEKDANGRTVVVRVGRTRLPARSRKANLDDKPIKRPFAMHKPVVSLLSRIVNAISLSEPILLTGETGTGKTSVVSHLASLLHQPLISLNLSHQTESSDLIGGLKPIDPRIPGSLLQEQFVILFSATFSRKKNEKFETEVRKAVNECKWKRAVGLWKESVRLATERIQARTTQENRPRALDDETPRKRRKTECPEPKSSELAWTKFLHEIEEFEVQHVHGKGKFAFGFVEGPLIKALRCGDWVLLDEVNLATPETLECISGLLQGPTASITLTEQGSLEPVPRHHDFRLFACMNPATDVGKKDLPPPIRSRFTEIDVPSPDADKDTLIAIISQYVGHIAISDKRIIMDIAEFYISVKRVAESRAIADGANHRPHFSMRTLVRALTFAADTASMYSLRRSIWEGCLMAFTMALDGKSAEIVEALARKHLLSGVRNPKSVLSKDPATPGQGQFIKFGPFYLERGPLDELQADNYVITPSVEQKIINLARIILTRRFPVLIEGPTSSGKTSSIEYLAKRTGHRFVRINNHDHTDIQEYIGSYVSDPLTGKLIFKDGLLVQALRHGHWIVLDELNLAPTDVLEALNRLLDDNRELVIPETQEVVRPHPHFMLFATQNPPGLYAGRKVLSRAFRNRFLEVHFEDVPQDELETILCQRCLIAPSYGKRIVSVFHELQKRRQTGRVFESKQGFATLRDLFRWAGRDAMSYQELAENGYMLLAERTRRADDKVVVKEVIESVMGVRIDEDAMYDLFRPGVDTTTFLGFSIPPKSTTIWTKAMQRLYTLVSRGLRFNEPILLVGETGSGKTSVCQVFVDSSSQRLLTLNCHQNTETADLIGGLRPVRNRSALQTEIMQEASLALRDVGIIDVPSSIDAMDAALSSALKKTLVLGQHLRNRLEDIHRRLLRLHSIFEWYDGPLVEAMRRGDVFLLDEISLADDSVLERLNSVLEPGRSIVLAERGGTVSEQATIHASEDFKLIATMNPGGDYGKKELSPALRNRFTEIWVPPVHDKGDLELIIHSTWQHSSLQPYTSSLLNFVDWLCCRVGDRSLMSLRDILAWVTFMNSAYTPADTGGIISDELFHHAAHMTYLDGLGSLPQLTGYSSEALDSLKKDALEKLDEIVPLAGQLISKVALHDLSEHLQLGCFAIPKGSNIPSQKLFNFDAPTTLSNAMRVVRACQVPKPILLEGSPGVGKTSLVTALAELSGNKLCRINLSDQTDLIDLFGSDLPVEGGTAGEFAWKDAEFLRALQRGHWVLLDEMNLAPQAVLEGLNAILDHRGRVYIPELNRSFSRHPKFRIFAAQNPLHQGGGRKGLPKSFVNRFTKVYLEELTSGDFYTVCSHVFPDIDESTLRAMISFNIELNQQVSVHRSFGQDGSPWEFNLRDIIRWGTLSNSKRRDQPHEYLRSVYLQRFRTPQDRVRACAIFDNTFCTVSASLGNPPPWTISPTQVQVGHSITTRNNSAPLSRPRRILKMQLAALESLGDCVSQSWLAILTGKRNSGKTDVVRVLADITGNPLLEVSINNATDTMDILGSFEQVGARRRLRDLLEDSIIALDSGMRTARGLKVLPIFHREAHELWESCVQASIHQLRNIYESFSSLLIKIAASDSTQTVHYQQIQNSLQSLSFSSSEVGHFEWVDGPLVKAMKSGHWLLLDGANHCDPSVLDRLNSLCESHGSLMLSERGFVDGKVQVIEPHPNFRLFMSVDPLHGELSRAMRNRGLEIALSATPLGDDEAILRDYYRLPASSSSPSQNPNLPATIFEAVRRGLTSHPFSQFPWSASSGRSLDQDSALSYMVDNVPALLIPLPGVADLSWVYFLSRSLVPSYMPYVMRYLTLRPQRKLSPTIFKFINEFPHQDLNTALESLRQSYVGHKKISPPFILHQPTFFYWNDSSRFSFEVDVSIPPAMVFEIINLSATIFICELDRCLDQVTETHSLKERDHRTRQAVVALYKGLLSFGAQILIESSNSPSNLVYLKLISTILSSTTDLKGALKSPSYDFSAIYAISHWLIGILDQCPSRFTHIFELAKALHSEVSLSTGLGLFAVWSRFYLEEPLPTLRKSTEMTDRLVASSDFPALRMQAFNIVSIESLPAPLKAQKGAQLLDIGKSLDECLRNKGLKTISEEFSPVDPSSMLLELHALELHYVGYHAQHLNHLIQEIVSLACRQEKASLLRIIPYQHLAWAAEVEKGEPSLVVKAQMCWLEGLWNGQTNNPRMVGPSILLHPILLHKTLSICDMSQVKLSSLNSHGNLLRHQTEMAIIESRHTAGRVTQLIHILYQALSLIASCFAASYDTAVYRSIQSAVGDTDGNLLESLSKLVTLLLSSKDVDFLSSLQNELVPLLVTASNKSQLQILGFAWVSVSRLLLNLIIPDAPMDPAAVQNCTSHRLQHEELDLSSQIRLHHQLERILTGNAANEIIGNLEPKLRDIQVRLANSPILPSRSDVPRLHLFWSEVLQFQKTILSTSKIDGLLHSLVTDDTDASHRERVIQGSLAGFYQRLDTVYPEFADISSLVKLCILYTRFGLRVIADSTSSLALISRTEWATSLLMFPSACSTGQIINNFKGYGPSGTTPFGHVSLALAALALEKSLGLQKEEHAALIDVAYDQAIRLWLVDRAKEKQQAAEASTLYRQANDNTVVTEAEIEEQEFLEMFPTFEDSSDSDHPPSRFGFPPSSLFVQPEDMALLVDIHYDLMDIRATQPHERFYKMKYHAIQMLVADSLEILPGKLDQCGIQFQFSILRDNILMLDETRSSASKPYNFYSDPNYQELRNGAIVITNLHKQLGVISEEWPDQMVVKHLMEKCQSILEVGSHSPVAKILTLVEQLLIQSEDWEMYSNRHNSIKIHQEALVRLVVTWRRLELSCWRTLLDSQASKFAADVSEWWFRLYDAVVRGTASAVDQDPEGETHTLDQYLSALIPLIDDFITASPLGQFDARMQLVHSFERYVAVITPSKSPLLRSAFQRVRRILSSAYHYYDLFSDQLRKNLLDEKVALEKEVKAFIKLASWKDVNVQALKQSAQCTHRQLYKVMKKFRDVLRQPVVHCLQPHHAGEPEVRPLSLDEPPVLTPTIFVETLFVPPIDSPLASRDYLSNLKRTFERYHALIGKRIRPFIIAQSAEQVDGAAVEIITTSKSLASLSIPPSLSSDLRIKHKKALLVRKRKALGDMLKELKRTGLASNVKPEILRQNTNQQWIREQPYLPDLSGVEIKVDRGESYFVKLCGSLPSLRISLPTHHSDLTTRELQRGTMFLESGFAIAVDLRARLFAALHAYQKIQTMSERLKMLSPDRGVRAWQNPVPHVLSLKVGLCKLAHGLSETRDSAITLNKLQSDVISPEACFYEISTVLATTDHLLNRLRPLVATIEKVALPFLTQEETDLLLQAENHLSHTYETVSQWCKTESQFHYLLSPLQKWLREHHIMPLLPLDEVPGADATRLEALLDALLVSVQSLVSRCPVIVAQDEEDAEKYLLKGYQFARDFTYLLNLDNIKDRLDQLLSSISSRSNLFQTLERITPFLMLYLLLAKDQLAVHNNWMKALFKLDFVLCSVLQTLSQQGFCQPPDGEDKDPNGEGTESVGGVGIGEGSGIENVGKEIEDESQIEGLKGEDTENNDNETDHDDGDAIEMDDDIGGKLEDVPDKGSDNEAESDDGSDPEFDETLGELDDLESAAIDEKIWGDEKGPEDSGNSEEKAEKDLSKEQGGPSELIAKESNVENQSKDKPEDNEDKDSNAAGEEEGDVKSEDGNDDSNDPNTSGAPMDEHVQEANTLDLPDEMELGGDEMAKDRIDDSEDDEVMDDENEPVEEGVDGIEDFTMEESSRDVPPAEDDTNNPSEGGDDTNPTLESDQRMDEEQLNDEVPVEAVAQPDISKEGGTTDPNEIGNPEPGQTSLNGEVGTSRGGAGESSVVEEKAENDEGSMEDTRPSNAEPTDNGTGTGTSGIQEGQTASQSGLRFVSNPLRSLGDALKEIRQHFDEILNADQKDAPREQAGESDKPAQLEYLRPEDADHDMQALGPAGDEQAAKLNQLTIIDDEMDSDEAPMVMDLDPPLPPEKYEEPSHQLATQSQDSNGMAQHDDIEGAILRTSLPGQERREAEFNPSDRREDDVPVKEDGKHMELQLREWRIANYPEEGADHVWRLYESLTHDLAYTLCEQLRLILEPTKATRLKGDYRTGKRLNMKKVISYIASDYTKDKIWLRRTKPSQREYQVLISIDDSRSMAESHSNHLAYQTLALISKALSRLESGDVAIAKFGESVDLLHGFDQGPFTDQAGAKVLKAFRFSQKATNVLSLLETSLKVLESARERHSMSSASATDLWQLQFIISDGMCQDHEKLRTVLRKAEEQRVMIVFIILDSLQTASAENPTNQSSILTMDKAEFKTVDGKMELQLQKYLDSFPFEYYVVLRYVEALPEVLAGTLKQFFERISGE